MASWAGCGSDRAEVAQPEVDYYTKLEQAMSDVEDGKSDSFKPKQTLADLCAEVAGCIGSYEFGTNSCGFNALRNKSANNWYDRFCRSSCNRC